MPELRRNISRLNVSKLILVACLVLIVPLNGGLAYGPNLVIYGLVFLTIAISLLIKPPAFSRPDEKLCMYLILLIALAFLSVLWGPNKNSSLNAAYIYGLATVLFISLLNTFKDEAMKRAWLWAYIWIAGLGSLVGLASLHYTTIGRLQFGAILANSVAAFLTPAILVCLFGRQALRPKTKLALGGLNFLTLCITVGFIFTFSRGGLVCLLIGSLAIMILNFGVRSAAIYTICTLVVLSGLMFGLSHWQRVQTKYSYITQNAFRSSSITIHDREIYAKSALDLFKRHPVFGAGAGSYRIEGITDQPGVVMQSTNPHSAILQYLAEFGVVGVAVLALALWQLFSRFWQRLRDPSSRVLVVATLTLMLHFSIDIDTIYPPLIFLLASLAALAVSTQVKKPSLAGG